MAKPQREPRTSSVIIVILLVASLGVGAGYVTCQASQEVRTEGTGVDGPGTTPSKR
jgi:hypothetical protein